LFDRSIIFPDALEVKPVPTSKHFLIIMAVHFTGPISSHPVFPEMTYYMSSGALNSTHSLTLLALEPTVSEHLKDVLSEVAWNISF